MLILLTITHSRDTKKNYIKNLEGINVSFILTDKGL